MCIKQIQHVEPPIASRTQGHCFLDDCGLFVVVVYSDAAVQI